MFPPILVTIGSLLAGALMFKRFFCKTSLSSDFYGSKFGSFLDWRPPHSEFEVKRYVSQSEHDFRAIKRAIRTKLQLATYGLTEETEKKTKKQGELRKSQNRYISPPCGGAISQPICTKFGEFVDLTNVITC